MNYVFLNEVLPPIIITTVIIVYVFAFYFLIKTDKKRLFKSRFLQGVDLIIKEDEDMLNRAQQVLRLYRRLCSRYGEANIDYINVVGYLEEIALMLTTNSVFIKKYSGDKFNRKSIEELIDKISEIDPYGGLNARQSELIESVKNEFRRYSSQNTSSIVSRIINEISVLQRESFVGKRKNLMRNNSAYILSVIGVVLTIVFGLVSLIM